MVGGFTRMGSVDQRIIWQDKLDAQGLVPDSIIPHCPAPYMNH
jgi:hypothetical protein